MSDLEISIRGPEAAKMRFSCIQAQVCSYRILKAFVFPLLVSLTFLKELTQNWADTVYRKMSACNPFSLISNLWDKLLHR